MDELAKTEARNYLSAAGFFIIGAAFLLNILIKLGGSGIFIEIKSQISLVIGIGLIITATLLIFLRKRDLIAILFFIIGFYNLYGTFTTHGLMYTIMMGFLVLVSLVTLTSKDKVKWLLFLIPSIWFVMGLILEIFGLNNIVIVVFSTILAVISLYYAFACACERCKLPGSKLLTVDESTDFKASGSVLGYMLFALISGGYTLYYIFGETVLPLDNLANIELICAVLIIFVAILLLAVGKMRFTPIMFLLIGLTSILSIYSSGLMFVGIGILFIVIGLFAMLRKESKILPGIMLIVYGCSAYAYINGVTTSANVVSAVLNAISCLIAIYLSFIVFSQRKLPKI